MAFTAVQSAEGTLTQSAVSTVNFGTGASTPIRYAYVAVTNDSGTTPAPIYFTTDGTTPTVGGQDCFAVDPNDTVVIANGSPLWTQAQNVMQAGTQIPSSYTTASTPWQATGYGTSLGGGVANPGTTVKLISAQAMAYTVSGSG